MKDIIINKIMDSISKYYSYDKAKLEEIRYGLLTLYLSIFKIIVIFIISFFIHTTKSLCLLFLYYLPLRVFGFGLHTKNSKECWILSISTFSLLPYLIKRLLIDDIYLKVLSLPLLVLIIKYAPSDTEKRPLTNKKKRIVYKILSSLITLIYIILIYSINSLYTKKALFFSILLEALLILPISYKLLGLKYKNYMCIKKEGGKK